MSILIHTVYRCDLCNREQPKADGATAEFCPSGWQILAVIPYPAKPDELRSRHVCDSCSEEFDSVYYCGKSRGRMTQLGMMVAEKEVTP